jgi:hypothetical protein
MSDHESTKPELAMVTATGAIGQADMAEAGQTLITAISTALAHRVHLWVACVTYGLDPENLAASDRRPLRFGSDTLLTYGVCCLVCETNYAAELLDTPCPGEPVSDQTGQPGQPGQIDSQIDRAPAQVARINERGTIDAQAKTKVGPARGSGSGRSPGRGPARKPAQQPDAQPDRPA